MERYHVRLLPVVEETGVLLGLVSEAHILAAWEADPFLPVSEVMAAWSPPWEWEEAAEADEQPPGVRLLRAVELLEAEPADGP